MIMKINLKTMVGGIQFPCAVYLLSYGKDGEEFNTVLTESQNYSFT